MIRKKDTSETRKENFYAGLRLCDALRSGKNFQINFTYKYFKILYSIRLNHFLITSAKVISFDIIRISGCWKTVLPMSQSRKVIKITLTTKCFKSRNFNILCKVSSYVVYRN